MSKRYFILQGGAENLDWIENYRAEKYQGWQFFWTVPRAAKKGDHGFIYLCAPLSRIVGRVSIIGEPFHNTSGHAFDNPVMRDKWCAEILPLEYFPLRDNLRMCGLRKIFGGDWRWLAYPRGNTEIPGNILPVFLEVISEFNKK